MRVTDKIQLIITMQPDFPPDSVKVDGPLHDKMLCYAMLAAAKEAVTHFNPAAAGSPRIFVPELPNGLGRG